MSDFLFPTLPGLGWSVIRTPIWSTNIKKTVSGREVRASYFSAPLYKYALTYDVLRQGAALAEWQTLMGFYNARSGAYDSFLFDDPNDDSTTLSVFDTGDGTTAVFQLARTLGGASDPVYNITGTPLVYVGGVLQTAATDYTIGAGGVVLFTPFLAPPAAPSGVGSTTGGSLAAATYYAKVSALNALGESLPSVEAVGVVTTGTTSSIVWTWPARAGATSYSLYVGTATGVENTKIALGNVLTYTQTAALAAGSPLTLPTASTVPANNAVLTWTGTYRWRVRFDNDSMDFDNFAYLFWAAKKVDLITVKGA